VVTSGTWRGGGEERRGEERRGEEKGIGDDRRGEGRGERDEMVERILII
jgi:hypothetical protein